MKWRTSWTRPRREEARISAKIRTRTRRTMAGSRIDFQETVIQAVGGIKIESNPSDQKCKNKTRVSVLREKVYFPLFKQSSLVDLRRLRGRKTNDLNNESQKPKVHLNLRGSRSGCKGKENELSGENSNANNDFKELGNKNVCGSKSKRNPGVQSSSRISGCVNSRKSKLNN